MGWSTYLVHREKKIIVEIGKVSLEDLRDELKSWKDISERSFERQGLDLDTKLMDLTARDAVTMLEAEEMVAGLSEIRARILALDYMRIHDIEPMACNIIGDEAVEKYKGYTVI